MMLEKPNKTFDCFQKATQIVPGEGIYWSAIAIYYFQNGNYTEAFDNIIKATTLQPDMSENWYNLGILYERCNQPEEAKIAYNKVLEIKDDDEMTQERL